MDNSQEMVVACVDGSPLTDSVVDYAAWASQRIEAPLKLLHNVEHRDISPMDLSGNIGLGAQEQLLAELVGLEEKRSRILLQEGREILSSQKERVLAAGYPEPVMRQRNGALPESLIDCEDEIRLLVMGIRGEKSAENTSRLGSQLETVARSLHKPILVVNRSFSAPERIMLAYDGSEGAVKALEMVARRPLFRNIECHLVNVSSPGKDISGALQAAEKTLKDVGLTVHTAALEGAPEEALIRYQQEQSIDLVVMGAFSHTRIRDLFVGSLTVRMLLKAQQPLLLLR